MMWNKLKNFCSKLFKKRKYTVSSIVKEANGSLKALQFIVRDAVKYKKEKIDKWQTPQETLDLGYGDCDCFARLYITLLSQLGYKPYFYIGYNDNEAHAFTMFKKDDKWCATSNADIIFTNVKGLEEAQRFIYPAKRYEKII